MKIKSFLNTQSEDSKAKYKRLLKMMGSLSALFSTNNVPYLYYRSMENIFCISFEAEDLSRADSSIDAKKGDVGIGLKTFLHNNGKTYQKIAEFNALSPSFRDLGDHELVVKVAMLRNKRLLATREIYGLDYMLYHLVTRRANQFLIYEENMDYVDINNIKVTKSTKTTVQFTDRKNFYTFSKSKSTLLKLFDFSEILPLELINIKIMSNPYEYLISSMDTSFSYVSEESKDDLYLQNVMTTSEHIDTKENNYIILPLYSDRSGIVEEKSGLNMWNAQGRPRDEDEVYITIPIWVHRWLEENNPSFFNYKTAKGQKNYYKTESFDTRLPNGRILSTKVTQQNGKALQSNPNKELGKWILRDVLQIPYKTTVTIDMLYEIGIDSVKLTKVDDNLYYMDFLEVGSFEKYKEKNNK